MNIHEWLTWYLNIGVKMKKMVKAKGIDLISLLTHWKKSQNGLLSVGIWVFWYMWSALKFSQHVPRSFFLWKIRAKLNENISNWQSYENSLGWKPKNLFVHDFFLKLKCNQMNFLLVLSYPTDLNEWFVF